MWLIHPYIHNSLDLSILPSFDFSSNQTLKVQCYQVINYFCNEHCMLTNINMGGYTCNSVASSNSVTILQFSSISSSLDCLLSDLV